MKYDDDFEILFEHDSVTEEQLEQFCREVQQLLASDEEFGKLLLKTMSESPLSDRDMTDKDAQIAVLLAAENPRGILH